MEFTSTAGIELRMRSHRELVWQSTAHRRTARLQGLLYLHSTLIKTCPWGAWPWPGNDAARHRGHAVRCTTAPATKRATNEDMQPLNLLPGSTGLSHQLAATSGDGRGSVGSNEVGGGSGSTAAATIRAAGSGAQPPDPLSGHTWLSNLAKATGGACENSVSNGNASTNGAAASRAAANDAQSTGLRPGSNGLSHIVATPGDGGGDGRGGSGGGGGGGGGDGDSDGGAGSGGGLPGDKGGLKIARLTLDSLVGAAVLAALLAAVVHYIGRLRQALTAFLRRRRSGTAGGPQSPEEQLAGVTAQQASLRCCPPCSPWPPCARSAMHSLFIHRAKHYICQVRHATTAGPEELASRSLWRSNLLASVHSRHL